MERRRQSEKRSFEWFNFKQKRKPRKPDAMTVSPENSALDWRVTVTALRAESEIGFWRRFLQSTAALDTPASRKSPVEAPLPGW